MSAPPDVGDAPATGAAPVVPARAPGAGGTPPAGAGGTPRWRRHWFPVLAALVLLATAVVLLLARSTTSALPLAPDNPMPAGAMAVAEILGREGVDVHLVRTTDDAVRLGGAGTTLLVTGTNTLDADHLTALRGTAADLVLVQTPFAIGLEALTDAVEPDPAGARDPVAARCTDPDALAAEQISRSTGGLRALRDDVELCFPTGDGTGAYAVWEQDGRSVRAIADGELLSNGDLADSGNAALVLRVLGQHPDLVWYIPTPGDTVGPDGPAGASGAAVLPPEATVLGLQLALLALVVIAWRARRLGPVVTEAMPVVVRAAETTRGRGRLYRRSGAHAHAAAALRAGCAHRLARALGLPRSAAATTLVEATARATGRTEDELGALLYGTAPTDDASLLALTHALDTLESEVHRP
ncbi:DUF4350 domain-containing protein [Georgenia wangjunii]|uniref:DUF4350 domain-containing protein n=1 Tax=Georgenia wangjunii TaxID=3117730 RepID=UPI002F26BCDE